MTERENLPAVIVAQALAVLSEQHGSLVGRGLMALRKDNETCYRQARTVFDRYRSRLGRWIMNWRENENPALFAAFKIFQQLANQNYGKAYYPLSILCGGKRDIEEGQDHVQHLSILAFDWCFANQANQDVELWCDLGDMYDAGHGVGRDVKRAVYWYHKAAEQGDAQGQSRLGFSYSGYEGCGIEKNDEQAVYWSRKAAEQGNADGQCELGFCYSQGFGVEQNGEQAVYWFRKAAEQGDTAAQCYLGLMYEEGTSVPQDYDEAMKWYRLAADQGDDLAQNAQEALRKLGIDWK